MSSKVKTVAILSDVPKLYACIAKQLPSLQLFEVQAGAPRALTTLKQAEVIVGDFDKIAEYLYQLDPGKTKWVQGTWAGAEPVIREYERAKRVPPFPISRFSGEHFGTIMSEYVVAQVTAFERDFKASWEAQKERKWYTGGKVKDYKAIRDMKVGLLGSGSISSHIAGVLKMLGANIWCLVRSVPVTKSPAVDQYRTANRIEELLEKCDLLINVLPHSAATVGLLNSQNLKTCEDALFVNIGRGSIITEADLLEALDKNHFRGAILDVLPEEPLPPSSKLWDIPQVIITPHVAGLTRAQDVAEHFKANLELWEIEGRLLNTLDFEKGY